MELNQAQEKFAIFRLKSRTVYRSGTDKIGVAKMGARAYFMNCARTRAERTVG